MSQKLKLTGDVYALNLTQKQIKAYAKTALFIGVIGLLFTLSTFHAPEQVQAEAPNYEALEAEIEAQKLETEKEAEKKRKEAKINDLKIKQLELEKERLKLQQEIEGIEIPDIEVETEPVKKALEVESNPRLEVKKITRKLDNLEANYKRFEKYYKADSTCHPYLIAAIHYRETNFGTTNGWNGQGAFQNLSNRYTPNSKVTDWNTQVRQACLHLKGKVGVQKLTNLDDVELIATALAKYNGCRSQHWTLCSYVSNYTTHYKGNGTKCAVDGCSRTTKDTRQGALAIVMQLQF